MSSNNLECLVLSKNMSITCQFNTNTEVKQMINRSQTNNVTNNDARTRYNIIKYTDYDEHCAISADTSPVPMALSSLYWFTSPNSSETMLPVVVAGAGAELGAGAVLWFMTRPWERCRPGHRRPPTAAARPPGRRHRPYLRRPAPRPRC